MTGRILFLTLKTFSATGGIEKVCRIAGKALSDLKKNKCFNFSVISLHDNTSDVEEKYISEKNFKGFGGHKIQFILNSIKQGKKSNIVILSHVNLLAVGYAIKKVSPKTTVILFAHGIEVWDGLPLWKKSMLLCCDEIWAVSQFTKNKLIELHDVPMDKISVFNNCIDPFLLANSNPKASDILHKKYNINPTDKVLVTLSRLSSKEKYKGYDSVIRAIEQLKVEHSGLKYLLIGKYDKAEKQRLDDLILSHNLKDSIVFTGYVNDDELGEHFAISDFYIMPSIKEGFGIAFIEALYYGKPVIAGNRDGSVDALANGHFGLLIDPLNENEIKTAIQKVIASPGAYKPVHSEVEERFGFEVYKKKLDNLLAPYLNKIQTTTSVLN